MGDDTSGRPTRPDGGLQNEVGPGAGDAPLPATPSRDFGYTLSRLRTSPGARKEALRRRSYQVGTTPRTRGPGYAELRTASAFSFLSALIASYSSSMLRRSD